MLRITKGLRQWPFISVHDDDNDNSEGITIYTDSNGDDYVRVNIGDEKFYIAAHDYVKNGEYKFTWDDAMTSLKADRLTTFTKEQAMICMDHLSEINDKLKEIDGDLLKNTEYWTSTEYDADRADVYCGPYIINTPKDDLHSVRPILNLK